MTIEKCEALKRIAAFVAVREKMAGTDPEVITESNGVSLLMSDLRAALSPAELGGVVTFDVVREVVKARTRLGFASPEGQEEQAARAIELIRELCEEVVSLNSASWVAEVITVTEPGDKGVRIRWRGGFPQVGDKLYTTPRAAEAVTDGDALFLLECADTLAKDFRHHMADKLREFVKQKALTPPSAKGE